MSIVIQVSDGSSAGADSVSLASRVVLGVDDVGARSFERMSRKMSTLDVEQDTSQVQDNGRKGSFEARPSVTAS